MWSLIKYQFSTARGIANQLTIQVASVFGAMALISFFDQIYEVIFAVDLNFQGFLEPIAMFWQENFRPAVRLIFLPIVKVVRSLLGVDIEVPGVVLDYFAVGLTLVLSRWRGAAGGWRGGASKAVGNVLRRPMRVALLSLQTLVLWPLVVVGLIRTLLLADRLYPERGPDEISQIRFSHLLALLPVLFALSLACPNALYLLLSGITSGKKQS